MSSYGSSSFILSVSHVEWNGSICSKGHKRYTAALSKFFMIRPKYWASQVGNGSCITKCTQIISRCNGVEAHLYLYKEREIAHSSNL